MSLVGGQLSGFAADMERDSKAQRLELAAAVDAVARRGRLRLSSAQSCTTHAYTMLGQAASCLLGPIISWVGVVRSGSCACPQWCFNFQIDSHPNVNHGIRIMLTIMLLGCRRRLH